jgi:hypothetical protein
MRNKVGGGSKNKRKVDDLGREKIRNIPPLTSTTSCNDLEMETNRPADAPKDDDDDGQWKTATTRAGRPVIHGTTSVPEKNTISEI